MVLMWNSDSSWGEGFGGVLGKHSSGGRSKSINEGSGGEAGTTAGEGEGGEGGKGSGDRWVGKAGVQLRVASSGL